MMTAMMKEESLKVALRLYRLTEALYQNETTAAVAEVVNGGPHSNDATAIADDDMPFATHWRSLSHCVLLPTCWRAGLRRPSAAMTVEMTVAIPATRRDIRCGAVSWSMCCCRGWEGIAVRIQQQRSMTCWRRSCHLARVQRTAPSESAPVRVATSRTAATTAVSPMTSGRILHRRSQLTRRIPMATSCLCAKVFLSL